MDRHVMIQLSNELCWQRFARIVPDHNLHFQTYQDMGRVMGFANPIQTHLIDIPTIKYLCQESINTIYEKKWVISM